MSFIKKIFSGALLSILALTAVTTLISGPAAYAQLTPSTSDLCGGSNCPVADPGNVGGGRDGIVSLIIQAAQFLTFIFAAVAVLFLVWGGVQFVISNGDDKKVESGKKTILYAVIGLIVSIVAFSIVGIISRLLTTGDSVL
jgi:hypothetical protein